MMDILQPSNLVAWAVQAAIVVAVAAPLPRLLGMWAPRVRMGYWRLVLVGCLLLPLLQVWQVRDLPGSDDSTAPSLAVDVLGNDPGALRSSLTETVAARVASRLARLKRMANRATFDGLPGWPIDVTGMLLAGVVLRFAWLGLGLFTLSRLRRSARPLWPRPPSVDRAATLAETDAEFLVSATASRPVTCGWAWPVVLVPRNFETFPENEQTAIAAHELLHVRRADWARNAIDELLRAVLWFHPAIWFVINEIQLAREQVVDREVVRRLGNRQPYLEALLRLARPAPRLVLTPASLFLKRAHLRERVTLLVKEASMSRARIAWSLAVMAIVVIIGGGIAALAFPLQQAGAKTPGVAVPAGTGAAPGQPPGAARPGVPVPAPGAGTTSPVPAVAVGGNTSADAGRLITKDAAVVRRWTPAYPSVAGRATVALSIEPDGTVRDARPVASVSEVDYVAVSNAAVEAAKAWKFAPTPPEARFVILGFNFTPANTVGSADAPVATIGGKIPPPMKIRDVKPVYPKEARDARVEGIQILEVCLAPSGDVLHARALRGQEPLIVAAMDAVLQWKFTPWDRPDERLMTVTVNFALARGPKPGGMAPLDIGAPQGTAAAPGAPTDAPGSWPGVEALRVGGDIKPPIKVRDVKPAYPKEARDSNVQGVVILDLLVGPDGKVQDSRILQSVPMLDKAAADAVMQWEFTPTVVNGNAVALAMTVTVNFTLQ